MSKSTSEDLFKRLCAKVGKGATQDSRLQLIEQECLKEGNYTAMCTNCLKIESTDQASLDLGFCSQCQSNSVSSALILAEII